MTPPGTNLGPYEIRALLGAGGMGEVYRAFDRRLKREVALKVLHAGLVRNEVWHHRFAQEAQALSALNHPNIVSIFDVNLESDPPYIVSELVEGESLSARLSGRKRMAPEKLIEIAVQIADGLATAHEAGIVHRDLKPHNILMTSDGRAKILDFGLAKQLRESAAISEDQETEAITLTDAGKVVGTVQYMSPEQAIGKTVDTRSDIFAFGVILYEMASGMRPFDRASTVETLTAILRDEPAAIEAKLPLPLRWTINRCLAKDPAKRYESTRDLYQELRYQSLHMSEALSVTTKSLARAPRLTPRWVALAGTLAGLLLGAILVLFLARPDPQRLASEQFQPVATGSEREEVAAWSPDGKSIAYQVQIGRTSQIFTKTIGLPSALQVTRGPGNSAWPAWSADGRTILYWMQYAVWSVGAAGGEPQRVIDNVEKFALSRDGTTLAIVRGTQSVLPASIWIASPPSAPPKRYEPSPFAGISEGTYHLEFSPNGKQLLFWLRAEGGDRGAEFWLLPVPAGSGKPRRVLQSLSQSAPMRGFAWMPDNRRLVVARSSPPDSYRTHLYVADVQTDSVTPLVTGIGTESSPAVSPDGTKLIYTANEYDASIVEVPLDGSGVRTLLATNRMEHSPSWSARTRTLAYVTDRSGADEIWVATPETGAGRPVVTQQSFPDRVARYFDGIATSPDGDRIAFVRNDQHQRQIWIAPVAGGAPVRVMDFQDPQLMPSWSPDGNWIAFYAGGKTNGLMKAKVGGGDPPVLLEAATGTCIYCTPDWSPTGEWISFSDGEGTQLVAPDGKTRKMVHKPPFTAAGWSPDGATLYGLTGAMGNQRVLAVDVKSGKEREVSTIDPGRAIRPIWFPGLRLSLSPDGKALATTAVRASGDLWMVTDIDHRPGLLARLGW